MLHFADRADHIVQAATYATAIQQCSNENDITFYGEAKATVP